VRSSEQPAQILRGEPGIGEDASKRASSDLSVERHGQGVHAVGVLQANVAATLADLLPALSLKRPHELLARDDRKPAAHAGSGNLRLMTPISKCRPSSRRPST